jgi:large subunit ribosomal protein L15
MLKLHNLVSSGKKRKRVGRGGERGGTSGKGGKGQTQRSGGFIRVGFEGGQTPLFRRLPKRGFNNADFAQPVVAINIGDIAPSFNDGDVITIKELLEKGLIKVKKSLHGENTRFLVKVLGNGKLGKKLEIEADAFSKSAQKLIEEFGGKARLTKEK